MFVESAAREADPKGQADAAAVGLQTIHLSEQHSVDALANGIVISPMGPLGRFHPSLAIQPREIDSMTGPLRELLQVLELDTAITFAKWMDEIHITQNWPDPVGKLFRARLLEIRFRGNPAMDIRHTSLNEPPRLELIAAFLDLDSPYLAGPFVNILKKMVVNRLEMIKVEIPRDQGRNPPWEPLPEGVALQTGAPLPPVSEDP